MGLSAAPVVNVMFVHFIDDNDIRNYPWLRSVEFLRVCKENKLRQIHYINYSPLNKDSITG